MLECQPKRNITIRMAEEEIEAIESLRQLKQGVIGLPVTRSNILQDCIDAGFEIVGEALLDTLQKFKESSQSADSDFGSLEVPV